MISMPRKSLAALFTLALTLVLATAPLAAQQSVDLDLEALAAYIEQARKDWKVPGLAVAIVHNDEVVMASGFGLREVGGSDPVDENTLFAIASNTKAFTAAAIARLVDQGQLKWDDRVIDHLPYFRLYSPFVTEEMRVVDLLCHRSGLKTFSGDLMLNGTPYSAEEIVRRARFLKPTGKFRADYGYSNIMFVAAGEVIAAVTGKPWETYIQEEFLTPLGMSRALPNVSGVSTRDNLATPHTELDGEVAIVPWHTWTNAMAAGGIVSSVHDSARWLRLQLARGTLDEHEYFSPASSRKMWTPHISFQVSAGSEERFPSTHFRGYGLGWGLSDFLGRKLVAHGGALDGMFSRTALVPEENLGIIVLTNSTTSITSPIVYRILDAYLGGEERDWSATYLERSRRGKQRREKMWAGREASRAQGTKPSLLLESYTGTYGGPMYGDATVVLKAGKLVLDLVPTPSLVADLTHWHHNTFEIHWRTPSPWYSRGWVQFVLDHQGNVTELLLDVPNDDFWFDEPEFKKKD